MSRTSRSTSNIDIAEKADLAEKEDVKKEIGDNDIRLKVTATFSYDPGRMYMPNGDPGYPPESEFDIEETDIFVNGILLKEDDFEKAFPLTYRFVNDIMENDSFSEEFNFDND